MHKVEIDTGTNQIDAATLGALIGISADAPNGLLKCEHEEPLLTIEFSEDPSERMAELLRVVGGCAKGDDPCLITSGPGEGQEVQPDGAPGATRWKCPRCSATVIEGRNNIPGIVGEGLCSRCHDVDCGRQPGAPAPAPAPAVTAVQGRPLVDVPATMGGTPDAPAVAAAVRPAVAVPATMTAPVEAPAPTPPPVRAASWEALEMSRIPIVVTATDLPDALRLGPGVFVFVQDSRRLLFSSPMGWACVKLEVALIG